MRYGEIARVETPPLRGCLDPCGAHCRDDARDEHHGDQKVRHLADCHDVGAIRSGGLRCEQLTDAHAESAVYDETDRNGFH